MANMLKPAIFVVLLFQSVGSMGQVGTWFDLPTLTEIRAITTDKSHVFAASDGGLLVFDKESGLFSSSIEGMSSDNLDTRVIYLGTDSLLWVGSKSPGSIIQVFDLKNQRELPVEFLELDEVTSFAQVGDSMYVTYRDGLSGGLLLYRKNATQIQYLDQFNNFPLPISEVSELIDEVAYNQGVLTFSAERYLGWIEVGGVNLKDPQNWRTTYLPTGKSKFKKIAAYADGLLVAASNALFTYNYKFYTQIAQFSEDIIDVKLDTSDARRVIYSTDSGLYEYDLDKNTNNQLSSTPGITGLTTLDKDIFIISEDVFFGSLDSDGTLTEYSANRPRDHYFNKIAVGEDGALVGGAYNGISIYTDEGWRTIQPGNIAGQFNQDNYNWNTLITDTLVYYGKAVVEDIIRDNEGSLYFSLQGRGVLRVDARLSGSSRMFTAADGDLEPTFDSETFVLPTQLAVDSQNNVYVTTKLTRDGGRAVTIITPDDSLYHIHQYEGGMDSRTVKSIAVDKNDRLWLGSQKRSELSAIGGIHFVDLQGPPGPDMEVRASYLSLTNNEIMQLEIDENNNLWILTPSGIQSMELPEEWLNSSELKSWANLHLTANASDNYHYWQLTDYNVTGIEIDSRGNRWFLSSNAGVHVLLQNGTWINNGYGYSSGNSDLLDNTVYSAAFDPESGEAFLSTPKGISVLKTPFADPKESYENLHIYPQPFNPDIHSNVIIQGLMDNSAVKILTVAGKLVRELSSADLSVQGYEASWDGTDLAGDRVGSGVYILYIYNEDGVVSSQKLAVLR